MAITSWTVMCTNTSGSLKILIYSLAQMFLRSNAKLSDFFASHFHLDGY